MTDETVHDKLSEVRFASSSVYMLKRNNNGNLFSIFNDLLLQEFTDEGIIL